MKRLQPIKDVSLALNAGQLDLRSPSGRTAEGAFRLIVNAIGDSRGQLRRLGGFRRLALSEPIQDSSFAIISDYGVDNSNEANVASLVNSWNPDFIVTAGDNVYNASGNLYADTTRITADSTAYTADQTKSVLMANLIFNLAVTQYYGSYISGNKFYPAIGNHDVDYDGTGAWFRSKFPSLFQNDKNYYTFQKGDIGFFILSSGYRTDGTLFEPDGNSIASIQEDWLKAALTSSTAKLKVVVFHHPPYSSTSNYQFPDLRWDFAGMGADVVINGHAHNYQRWIDKPIPYVVAGIGGANLYAFNQSTSGSIVDNPMRFGALRCTAKGHELKIEAIAVGGAVIDTLVLSSSLNEDLHDQLPDFIVPSSVTLDCPKVTVTPPLCYATVAAMASVEMPSVAVMAPTVEAESINQTSVDMITVSVVAPVVSAAASAPTNNS